MTLRAYKHRSSLPLKVGDWVLLNSLLTDMPFSKPHKVIELGMVPKLRDLNGREQLVNYNRVMAVGDTEQECKDAHDEGFRIGNKHMKQRIDLERRQSLEVRLFLEQLLK